MTITVENLSRSFDGKVATKDINFKVNDGEIVGLLGTSGSGKSTILRALSGLDTGYEGEILIDGKRQKGVEESTNFIFQEPRLFPWLSVKENVLFVLKDKNSQGQQEKVEKILDLVGLDGSQDLYPSQLSGGMAQRVAIARGLIVEPKLLLLDEPFSAVDAFTKMQLQDLILDIWNENQTSMVLVTHDIDEALYLCNRIIVLSGYPGTIKEEFIIGEGIHQVRNSQGAARLKQIIFDHLNLNQ